MKLGLTVGAMAGVALGAILISYYGMEDVIRAIAAAGFAGFLAVSAIRIFTLILCGWSWHVLYVGAIRTTTVHLFIWARWVRDSVSNLLGIVPGAGEAAGIRALVLHRIRTREAVATTIVDTTTELLSQIAFTLLGIMIMMTSGYQSPAIGHAIIGLAIATAGITAFVVAQNRGLFRLLETLPARLGLESPSDHAPKTGGVDHEIQKIYAHRTRVGVSAFVHLVAWLIGTLEAWIAFLLMGHPIGIGDAIALESFIFALRALVFFVPSALGVQEGGYVALGALFGLPPDIALAFSLLKRACEIATGLPAILAWQFLEGQNLWEETSRRPGSEEAR